MPQSTTDDDSRHSPTPPRWLTSELIIKAAGILVTLAGLYYGISAKVDRLSDDVKEIRQALPNKELDAQKMREIEKRLDKIELDYGAFDAWVRNTREKLAEHGWNVPDVTMTKR